jgi:hypothetical protein
LIQASSRDVKETEDEKFEEYERRREMRLKKRFAELEARVCQWREAVPPVSTIEVSFVPGPLYRNLLDVPRAGLDLLGTQGGRHA